MRTKATSLFAGCLIFLGTSSLAASVPAWTEFASPPIFEHINTAQGLSHGTVYSTLQDSRGFLWFGTENGLDRYDGFAYKQFHFEKDNPASLSSDWIAVLLEDDRQQLWVGTNGGGLNRVDRDTRGVFRYPVSQAPGAFPSDNVTALAQDSAGNVWIGTYGKGLVLLPAAALPPAEPRFRQVVSDPAGRAGLPGAVVGSLHVDRRGTLWVGMREGEGLCRLRGIDAAGVPSFDCLRPGSAPSDSFPADVIDMADGEDGTLWVATQKGLYARDSSGEFHHWRHRPGDEASLAFDLVRRVYRDRAGGIWAGTDGGGLDKLPIGARPGDSLRFTHFRHEGRLQASLASDAVESIFEDRSGVLWVGTYFTGLNKLVLRSDAVEHREIRPYLQYRHNPADSGSLSGDIVNAFAEDRFGDLWVGTDGHGLNRVRRPAAPGQPLRFERFRANPADPKALPEDVVTGLTVDSRGRLWMGTYTEGLVRVDVDGPGAAPRFTRYRHDKDKPESLIDNFLWSICEDGRGRIWAGGELGVLELFNPERGAFTHFRLPGKTADGVESAPIFAVLPDRFGTLWIATQKGLFRFDPETREFRAYQDASDGTGLGDSYVTALHFDGHGILWAGTNAGGLHRIEIGPWDGAAPRFQRFGDAQGLPSNSVMGILEDARGILWVSTPHNLSRFDPDSGRFSPFIWHEEIRRTAFIRNSVLRSCDGSLFFGGSNGFGVFRPEEVVRNPMAPPLYVTDFRLLNKSVSIHTRFTKVDEPGHVPSLADGLTLSHKDYSFSFEFAALHFVEPQENQYAYIMEGLDEAWTQARNHHFVAYTTLPPGDYTFRVRASNCDGVWGEKGLDIPIRVLPPWWSTWWCRVLLGTLFAAAFAAGLRLRMRALRRRNRLLETMVAEKTLELKDILDHIEQGLFTIGLDGKVNPDFSARVNTILGVEEVAGRPVAELLRMDDGQSEAWKTWLELVERDHARVRWNKLERLAPVRELTVRRQDGERFVRIGYQQMFAQGGRLRKLMILADDVTEAKRTATRAEEEKKRHEAKVKAILGVVKNARTLSGFLQDIETRLGEIEAIIQGLPPSPSPIEKDKLGALFRETHTIKGTTASLGFERFSETAHEMETTLKILWKPDGGIASADFARLTGCLKRMKECLEEIRDLVGTLMGAGVAGSAIIPEERVRILRDLGEALADRADGGDENLARLLFLCRTLDHVALATLAENYKGMLQRLANKLGKQVEFRVIPPGYSMSPQTFVALNEPLIHLLRNALDHGLETEAERVRLGKPPAGTLELRIESQGELLTIMVSDDGAGIDVEKVCAKSLELGLVTMAQLEAMGEEGRVALIFKRGLTTREQATEISGQGAGMDVVAEWIEKLGGKISVSTAKGAGTSIILGLPARFNQSGTK